MCAQSHLKGPVCYHCTWVQPSVGWIRRQLLISVHWTIEATALNDDSVWEQSDSPCVILLLWLPVPSNVLSTNFILVVMCVDSSQTIFDWRCTDQVFSMYNSGYQFWFHLLILFSFVLQSRYYIFGFYFNVTRKQNIIVYHLTTCLTL